MESKNPVVVAVSISPSHTMSKVNQASIRLLAGSVSRVTRVEGRRLRRVNRRRFRRDPKTYLLNLEEKLLQ